MNKDKNINKELEELSPFLAKMKSKKEDLDLPDNYFHYLENSVMQQVALEPTPNMPTNVGGTVSIWKYLFSPRGIMGLATVILLVFAGLYFGSPEVNITNDSLQFAELTDTEILDYLTENAEILDIYSLSEIDEEISVLDMIDLEEKDVEYIFEDNPDDIFTEDLF